jgi:hypothetical protein
MVPKPILLSREQIDAQTWDNHIHQSRQCVIYALSWYLDIVCEQWQALVWPSISDFSIVMPLPVRTKFGMPVLYQPLFCQYLGIFSKQELSESECEAFLEALKAHFSYISQYNFNPENFVVMNRLDRRGFECEVFQTHWLDLRRPYREIYASYSRDRIMNLKRSGRTVWEIIESDDLGPLIALFEENQAAGIGRIKGNAYRTLRELAKRCISGGVGLLAYARSGTHTGAGILLTCYRGRTIYLFNAADHEGRKGNARALMLDAYFRENADSGSVFDFESPQKESIAHYYAGFGALAKPFYCITRNALPFPFRVMQKLRKWLIRTRRCLYGVLCRISNPFPASRF